MVDVEQHALRSFVEDAPAGLAGQIQGPPDDADEGHDLRRDVEQLLDQVVAVEFGLAEAAQQRIVMQKKLLDLLWQQVRFRQVAGPDCAPSHLVLVSRADAPPRGADLGVAQGLFTCLVEIAVDRQDQRRVLGDLQRFRRQVDAELPQAFHLVQQGPGIEHDAVADDRKLALAHHARRQGRAFVGDAVDDQRMTGVMAALETDHHVRPLGKPVDDLSLAFVAPLGANHYHIGHAEICSPCWSHGAGPGSGSSPASARIHAAGTFSRGRPEFRSREGWTRRGQASSMVEHPAARTHRSGRARPVRQPFTRNPRIRQTEIRTRRQPDRF